MDRAISFNHDDQYRDLCTGAVYRRFLDYAFSRTDFFMLVYANYDGKGYTKIMKSFLQELKPFQVKRRCDPSWPGTPATDCSNTTYKIVFYKNCAQAKEILGKVDCLSAWTRPFYPQDLAFFKGNQCWFYSVGHERIAEIIHATDEDISFLEENGLANREDAYTPKNNWFDTYNEVIPRD